MEDGVSFIPPYIHRIKLMHRQTITQAGPLKELVTHSVCTGARTHAQYRQIHVRAQYAEYWRSYTRAQYSVYWQWGSRKPPIWQLRSLLLRANNALSVCQIKVGPVLI